MIVVACLGLATCLLLWWPPDPSRRVAAWLNRRHQSRTVRSVAGWTRGLVVVAALSVCVSFAPQLLVWLVPGLVVGCTVGWLIANSRAEKLRHHNSEEVVQACIAVATQLRVGDIAPAALALVAARF